MASQPHVAALSTTPVKSLRIQRRDRVTLQRDGAAGDRAFFLVDERGTMANAKRHPKLNQVVGELDADGVLTLAFPDGSRVSGEPRPGESVDARFYRLTRPAVAIEGDFSAALSAHVGSPLRLVAFEGGAPRSTAARRERRRCCAARRRTRSPRRPAARASTRAASG